ncbi:AAA family ATPase [Clostridiaceae bacterium]|nr:AAA family ATPase [Clostridiaceae bacterium]RKI18076.1 AAA family ATPase [bacterium 1XD21-70]
MKKKISVITLVPRSVRFYAGQFQDIFGELAEVRAYSTGDGSVEGIEPSDLYVVSTDAFKAEETRQYVPSEGQVVEIQLTYAKDVVRDLKKIPKGTRVLFVNISSQMARESVTQLEQLGVNQLHFEAYGPDLALSEEEACAAWGEVDMAVTPDEASFVPQGIEKVLNIGHRPCTPATIIEAALRLGLERLLEERRFQNYMKSLAPGNYSFEQMFKRSRQLESRFDILIEILDEGMVGVNERGECIGAFATLQRFNELERRQNELRSQLLHKGYRAKYCFDDVIGRSQAIGRTKEILTRMAKTESPVLLIGETGTGKELLAHAVHHASRRSKGPFVAINVAAVPENLLESELFGYEEGAFTGAKKGGRPGLFEFAHKGTLFLDEVEGMSPAMQVKLLRVLQEQEIMRVGGNQMINVDVRIVAATNESLEEKVAEGSFRRDLYYRLNALPALIPPLRERGEDILFLLEDFRRRLGGSFELSKEVREALLCYPWPGNIRELQNVVEYLSFTGQSVIGPEDLPPTFQAGLLREGKEEAAPGRKHPKEGGEESREFWYVLEQMYLASEKGEFIGREAMLKNARDSHIPLSQREVRDILEQMAAQGLAKVGKGRGGSRITLAGRRMWEERV